MATDSQMPNIFEVCDICGSNHNAEHCPELAAEPDHQATSLISLAQMTLPKDFSLGCDDSGVSQVVSMNAIPAKTKLGPFEARRTTTAVDVGCAFILRVFRPDGCCVTLDSSNENECNWLCLVQTASSDAEQNLIAMQVGFDIFYTTTRDIHAGEYLKVWYSPHYARKLGKPSQPDSGSTITLLALSRARSSAHDTLSTANKHVIEPTVSTDQSTSPESSCWSSVTPAGTVQIEARPKLQVAGTGDDPGLDECHSTVVVVTRAGAVDVKAKADIPYVDGPPVANGSGNAQCGDGHSALYVNNGAESSTSKSDGDAVIAQLSSTQAATLKQRSRKRKTAAGIAVVKDPKPFKHIWPCSLCPLTFTGPRGLGKHRKEQHLPPPPAVEREWESCTEDEEVEEKRRRSLGRSGGGHHSIGSPDERGKPYRAQSCADYAAKGIRDCVVHLVIEGPARDLALAKLAKKAERASVYGSDKASSDAGSTSAGVSTFGRGKRRKSMPKRLLDSSVLVDDSSEDDPDQLMSDAEHSEDTSDSSDSIESAPQSPVPPDSAGDNSRSALTSASSSFSARARCDKCQTTFERKKSLTLHRCPLRGPTGTELRATAQASLEACRRDDGAYSCPECCPATAAAAATRRGGGAAAVRDAEGAAVALAACTFASAAELEQHVVSHADRFLCDVCLRVVPTDSSTAEHCLSCTGPPGMEECAVAAGDLAALGAAPQQPAVAAGSTNIDLGEPPENEHPRAKSPPVSAGVGSAVTGNNEAAAPQVSGPSLADVDGAPLRCDSCDLTFSSPAYLERHLRIHAGSYACHKCGTHCTGSVHLLRHLVKCDRKRLATLLGSSYPPLACQDCSLPFASQVALSVHLATSHSELYVCRRCERKFHSKVLFESHDCVDTADEPTSCAVCEKTFYSKRKLRRHVYQHTLRFTCTTCDRPFNRKEDFVVHSLECKAARMLREGGIIKCPSCTSTFKDLATYKNHAELHTHAHKCSKCGRRFMRRINVVQHEKCCTRASLVVEDQPPADAAAPATAAAAPAAAGEAQTPDGGTATDAAGQEGDATHVADASKVKPKKVRRIDDLFICYVCGRCYMSKSNLNKHIKTHGDKQFVCPICSKKFHHYHTMRQHYDGVHTNLLNAQCPHCDKVFCTKYTMVSHIKQFHSDKVESFLCEHCGKSFRQKGNMRKHLLKHQDTHSYSCCYCPKTFRYPEQHRRHELIHIKGRSFACQHCDRKFVLQHELRKHQREFHNTNVYVCPECSEVCRWRHTVRRHIKRKHPAYAQQLESPAFLESLLRDVNEVGPALHGQCLTDVPATAAGAPTVIVDEAATVEAQQLPQAVDSSQLASVLPAAPLDVNAPEALHGSTIHLYSDEGVSLTPESAGALRSALTQSLDSLASGANPTTVSINGQRFTITVTPHGQTLLTPDIVIPHVLAPVTADASELQGQTIQPVDATTACDLPASGNLTNAPA